MEKEKEMKYIFVQVPKTYGSTIATIFGRNMSVFRVNPGESEDNAIQRGANEADFIYGHNGAEWGKGFSGRKLFTMMRDPVERVLSWYSYKEFEVPIYQWALRAFNESVPHKDLNAMDRMLCCVGFEEIEFGICEYFDLYLEYLKKRNILKDISYKIQNKTKNRMEKEDLRPATLQLLKDLLWRDYDVYEYAKKVFFERILA
jgi:hypothetical protein